MFFGKEKQQYEELARELARPSRFGRRCLAKTFFDAHLKAHKEKNNNPFRRIVQFEGITFCFLFLDDPDPRERRKAFLLAICWIARGKFQKNYKVIGIATEKKVRSMSSYDFCLLDIPEWTKEYQIKVEELQRDTGFLTNIVESIVHEDEYPQPS